MTTKQILSGKWNEGLKNGISGGNIDLAEEQMLFLQDEESEPGLGLPGGRGKVPRAAEKCELGLTLPAGVFATENIWEVPF